jgi:hypothetical protein
VRTLERGNVKDRQVVQRSCGEPPFVGLVDADELDSLGKVVRLRGQSYKFPPEVRNPQFGEINYSFVRDGEISLFKNRSCP